MRPLVVDIFLHLSAVDSLNVWTLHNSSVGKYDPLFEPSKILITTFTLSIEVPAQENLLHKVPGTSGKALTTKPSDQNLY